jgi:hypothetical protein
MRGDAFFRSPAACKGGGFAPACGRLGLIKQGGVAAVEGAQDAEGRIPFRGGGGRAWRGVLGGRRWSGAAGQRTHEGDYRWLGGVIHSRHKSVVCSLDRAADRRRSVWGRGMVLRWNLMGESGMACRMAERGRAVCVGGRAVSRGAHNLCRFTVWHRLGQPRMSTSSNSVQMCWIAQRCSTMLSLGAGGGGRMASRRGSLLLAHSLAAPLAGVVGVDLEC